MVVAYDAVTIGCRVLWLVAAVAIWMRSLTAPAAPDIAFVHRLARQIAHQPLDVGVAQ